MSLESNSAFRASIKRCNRLSLPTSWERCLPLFGVFVGAEEAPKLVLGESCSASSSCSMSCSASSLAKLCKSRGFGIDDNDFVSATALFGGPLLGSSSNSPSSPSAPLPTPRLPTAPPCGIASSIITSKEWPSLKNLSRSGSSPHDSWLRFVVNCTFGGFAWAAACEENDEDILSAAAAPASSAGSPPPPPPPCGDSCVGRCIEWRSSSSCACSSGPSHRVSPPHSASSSEALPILGRRAACPSPLGRMACRICFQSQFEACTRPCIAHCSWASRLCRASSAAFLWPSSKACDSPAPLQIEADGPDNEASANVTRDARCTTCRRRGPRDSDAGRNCEDRNWEDRISCVDGAPPNCTL
mmetsp:Transcript_163136/g.523126  ORF Transcript_163136/g.523126 Transcript_163136/m.523126 type:complete len:357 (-) Transcript_163136:462-1532(-)